MGKNIFTKKHIRYLATANILLFVIMLTFIISAYTNVSELQPCFQLETEHSKTIGKVHLGKFIYIEQDDKNHETWRITGLPFYINNTLVVWISEIDLLATISGTSQRKDYLIYDDSLMVFRIEQNPAGTVVIDQEGKAFDVQMQECRI